MFTEIKKVSADKKHNLWSIIKAKNEDKVYIWLNADEKKSE